MNGPDGVRPEKTGAVSRGLAALLLGVLAIQGAVFIAGNSVTFDEASHLAAGLSAWRTRDFKIYSKNPPLIRQLCTLPLLVMGVEVPLGEGWRENRGIMLINEIAAAYPGRFHGLVMTARAVTLLMLVVLGWRIFAWARKRFGESAGVAALVLFCFQPSLLAHGGLATVDLGAALAFFLAVQAMLQGLQAGWTMRRSLWLGALAGAALASKFSNLSLIFILPMIWLIVKARKPTTPWINRTALARGVLHLATILALSLLVIALCYGFQDCGKRLGEFKFVSRSVSRLARLLPPSLPVPLPYHFLAGLDLQSYDNEAGGGENAVTYWRGQWVKGRVPFFYPWLIAAKLTIPLLALAGLNLALKLWRGLSGRGWDREWLARLAAVFIHFGIIAYGVGMYFSFRYLLAVVPFLVLFASEATAEIISFLPARWPRRSWLALSVLAVISAPSSLLTCPHFLAYNNLFLGNEARQDRLDPDTSLTWGQDLIWLSEYLEKHPTPRLYLGYFGAIDPKYYGLTWEVPPPRPAPGTWAVSQNWLIENVPHDFMFVRDNQIFFIAQPKPYFRWLQKLKPSAKIGDATYIFELREDQVPPPAQPPPPHPP